MLIWQLHVWVVADLCAVACAAVSLIKEWDCGEKSITLCYRLAATSIDSGSMRPAASVATSTESQSPARIQGVGGLKSRRHPVTIGATTRRCSEESLAFSKPLVHCWSEEKTLNKTSVWCLRRNSRETLLEELMPKALRRLILLGPRSNFWDLWSE